MRCFAGSGTMERVTSPNPRRPILPGNKLFESLPGASDPATVTEVAHRTAELLVRGVRNSEDTEVHARVVKLADDYGLDELAELWSDSPSDSLPGALWRLYLLQLMIHDDPQTAALLYQRGRVEISSADEVVAGAPNPAGPDELVALIDTILRGLFEGDFAVALDRAAAFCRVQAAGSSHLADDYEHTEPERASVLTTRALRLADYASDIAACAALWRRDALT